MTQDLAVRREAKARRRRSQAAYFKRYWMLYAMLVLPIAFFVLFKYVPMVYIQIAFKQNNIIKSIWEVPLAKNNGFEWFIKAFGDRDFLYAIRNTLTLNLLDLLLGFPAPILLALLLNELAFPRFKRITQTVAYMPHFLSWIIISGISTRLFADNSGLINQVILQLGGEKYPFISKPTNWIFTYTALGIWKDMGWNTIIYLAALTAINPELYEAASVDGAGRFSKMWHITLPGIKPTIVTLLILNLGRILGSEFDRPFSLTNPLVSDVSNVISTYVYRWGIRGSRFSLTTAVGLFQSVICVVFLIASNALAKRMGERGVW